MRFSCERDSLANAIAVASRALGLKSYGNGVTLKLKGDTITIIGQETDMLIETRLEVIGNGDGEAVVPTPLTQDMIRSLPGGIIDISSDGTVLTIKSGKVKVSVYLVANYTTPFKREEDKTSVMVKSELLKAALDQVLRASAKNESREFVYTGVLFSSEEDGLRLVATDGTRMAVRDIEAAKKAGIRVIGVSWGYNTRAALQKANPDYIVEKPEDLQKIILNNN